MAEHTSNRSDLRQQRSIDRSEERIDGTWPGGCHSLINAYREQRTTLVDITRKTGVQFRALRRVFARHGVQMLGRIAAIRLARKLHPEWNEHISASKLRNPFRHPPKALASITRKRLATFEADPSRHGNAHARMTNREQQVAEILQRQGVAYKFNQPAAGYWLDFYLPDLRVGIEAQRGAVRPCPIRDKAIIKALNLKGILYAPTLYLRVGKPHLIENLVAALAANAIDFERIGNARFLCLNRPSAKSGGSSFKPRWISQNPQTRTVRGQSRASAAASTEPPTQASE